MSLAVQIYNILGVIAFGFLLYGMIKASRAGRPENEKNRAYHVKTFWVLFFGSILWVAALLIPLVHGVFVWTHFFAATGMIYTSYRFNKTIRSLSRERVR